MIAWAVRVSLPQLGSCLVAYLETNVSVLVLRIAIRKSSCKSFKRMPEGLILKIAGQLGIMTFRSNMEHWIKTANRLNCSCDYLPHFTQEELNEKARDCPPDISEEEFYQKFDPDYCDRHCECVNNFCRDLKLLQYPKIRQMRMVSMNNIVI